MGLRDGRDLELIAKPVARGYTAAVHRTQTVGRHMANDKHLNWR